MRPAVSPLPFAIVLVLALAQACGSGAHGDAELATERVVGTAPAIAHAPATDDPAPPVVVSCRTTSVDASDGATVAIRWITPDDRRQRQTLDRWCEGVGPILLRTAPAATPPPTADTVAVVSWNVHVGGGDIDGLVHRLRSGAFSANHPVRHFVLLLQEAYRAGNMVPRALRPFAALPDAIRPATGRRQRQDIAVVAARLGLNLYYAPSMRNGGPLTSDEDRGNAILSTLPLRDLAAIELPFERQRRVVVMARVAGRTTVGEPWRLTIASVHFDNLFGLRHVWIFSGAARERQARGLIAALEGESPAVVAGDFNTWFGYRDPAYRTMAEAFRDTPEHDRRPTFAGLLRLDHAFFRLPRGWRSSLVRLDDKFDSDHYPLLGFVTMRGSSG